MANLYMGNQIRKQMGIPIRSLMEAMSPQEDRIVREDVLSVLEASKSALEESMRVRIDCPMMVIIFCGGKSGSSALLEFFRTQNIPAVRIHNMDHFVEEHLRGMTPRPTFWEFIKFIRKYCGMINVIDSYRNPIERRMSSFFQNFRFNLDRMGVSPQTWRRMTLRDRMRTFEQLGIPILERRNGIDSIDKEFFMGSFDFVQKRQILDRDGTRMIKLRFVDIGDWPKILHRLIPGVSASAEMPRANITENEPKRGAEYAEWKQSFRLTDPSIFWFLVMDPIFHKYHTMEELVAYHDKWLMPPDLLR